MSLWWLSPHLNLVVFPYYRLPPLWRYQTLKMDPSGNTDWQCAQCTLINNGASLFCDACCANRIRSLPSGFTSVSTHTYAPPAPPRKAVYIPPPKNTGLECKECTVINNDVSKFCGTCGTKPIGHIRAEGVRDDEIRIVLIGKTGSGKSATGNTILGIPDHFQSRVCGASITKNCKRGEAFRFGKKLMVVDTPGLFDTDMTNELVTKEIVKCIGMTSPGPHAIVLVVQIGRFTKEEKDTVIQFADVFGEGMYNYLIVLFTRKDDLDRQGSKIDKYVTKTPEDLKQILYRCGQRYIAFDNIASNESKERDSKMLLSIMDNMIQRNGGSCYSNEMYSAAEDALKKRMEELRATETEKKNREIQVIRVGVAKEYQQLIDQERVEKLCIEGDIKELEEERKRDDEEVRLLYQRFEDMQRQGEKDRQRLREEQEETRRQQRELRSAIEQQQQLKDEQEKLQEKEMEEMRKIIQENEIRVEEQRQQLEKERERNQQREKERQEKMRENEIRFQENLERERQKFIEMQREQQDLEEQIEVEYRRNIEAESLRRKTRDECERGDKDILSTLCTFFKCCVKVAAKIVIKRFLPFI